MLVVLRVKARIRWTAFQECSADWREPSHAVGTRLPRHHLDKGVRGVSANADLLAIHEKPGGGVGNRTGGTEDQVNAALLHYAAQDRETTSALLSAMPLQ